MKFRLREWRKTDAEEIAPLANNRKVAARLRNVFPHPYTEQDAKEYIRFCLESGEETQICRVIEVEGRAAGSITVTRGRDIYEKSAELGYWLGEPFWGKGIMPEAVVEICRMAFGTWDIVRIFAEPFADNGRSRRVLEKAGFSLEGTMRRSVCKWGKIADSCMYALLKEDLR